MPAPVAATAAHLGSVLTDGAWAGRRCFVVGGGPSLKGFDFGRLAGELWIGCNVAAFEAPAPTIAFSICHRFMRDIAARDPRWAACPSLRVFMDPPADLPPSAAHVTIGNCGDTWGRSLAGGICQGPLSGLSAANLADILGPSVIYLLGMDCRVADEGRTANYHDEYWWNADREPRPKEERYGKARICWAARAPLIRSRVVLIGDSALEYFPRARLEDVLP